MQMKDVGLRGGAQPSRPLDIPMSFTICLQCILVIARPITTNIQPSQAQVKVPTNQRGPKPLMAVLTDNRSGTVNSNTVNSKFHLIRSYCEIFFYNFPNIPCLKYTVNSNFRLIRSKNLPMNDFELTVPDL